MSETTTVPKVYKFKELSDEAKETAIGNRRNWNVSDNFWSECVIEDAKTIGELFGLDIENVWFSGFSSQGDGACFDGCYEYRKGALKAIKEHAPEDTDLHEIVKSLQDIQRPSFYQLYAKCKQSGHYNHSGCMNVSVDCEDEYWRDDCDSDLTDQLRYFADWIYKRLEKEYDYQTSDKVIIEQIEDYELKFSESGEEEE